jgi:hypothetical protein
MSLTTLSISILVLIIIYPFVVHYQLKSFKTKMEKHWTKLEALIAKYKKNNSQEVLEKISFERRAYNSVIRANNHKLESMVGKFLSKKYGFETRENFEFKTNP